MLNNCVFIGRLVKAPEIKTVGEAKVANFTIAVNKRYKSKNENAPDADFIPVQVWKSKADFAEKYFQKGKQIFVVGRLETYSYDKDEVRHHGFRINATEVGFCGNKTTSDKIAEHSNNFLINEEPDFSCFGDTDNFSDELPI